MSTVIKATLVNKEQIKMQLPLGVMEDGKTFTLLQDNVAIAVLKIIGVKTTASHQEINLTGFSPIELGHRYAISDEKFNRYVLDISASVDFLDFDANYTYYGNDLGAHYQKKETNFALWSPLCSQVNLILNLLENRVVPMQRDDHGVYRVKISEDLDGVSYLYEIVINDIVKQVCDPYAIGSTLNAKASVVINKEKISVDMNETLLPQLNSYCDAIIYEASIRDLTSYRDTNIKHKGRFIGLAQSGATDNNGESVGFDYLLKLGITHLQLLPIFDFATVDEEVPHSKYNWGYDPQQYNVPEGSYASNLFDPYSRIIDLKILIAKLHKHGIKVNMDVVYNHVYEVENSIFEAVVPGYYFRKNKDGSLSNGSFCGNDLNTRRPMVRKYIVDSCTFWMKEYGIDGFRFDLMGIIDLETLKEIIKETRAIKPDCMLYGEGWNMPTNLRDAEKSTTENAKHLEEVAFFNDVFRDVTKGRTYGDDLLHRGFLLGNEEFREMFEFVFKGSVTNGDRAIFRKVHQSINYVECHDNATLFDKLLAIYPNANEEIIFKYIKIINAVNIFAFGVPFLHMGQELGLSKQGDHNSYKSGDIINQMNYGVLKSRHEIFKHFTDAIKLRHKLQIMRTSEAEQIDKIISFESLGRGIVINYKNDGEDLKIFINPTATNLYYELEDYYRIIFNEVGIVEDLTYAKSLMISPLNLLILTKSK